MNKFFTVFTLGLVSFSAWTAPYDTLSQALNEKVLISDLRSQCVVPTSVSDEKIKTLFLNSGENHHTLSVAADALKKGRHEQYRHALAGIVCPPSLTQQR